MSPVTIITRDVPSSGNAMVMGNMIYGTGKSSGTATTTATPVYRYSRAIAFEARLSDQQTSRGAVGVVLGYAFIL